MSNPLSKQDNTCLLDMGIRDDTQHMLIDELYIRIVTHDKHSIVTHLWTIEIGIVFFVRDEMISDLHDIRAMSVDKISRIVVSLLG